MKPLDVDFARSLNDVLAGRVCIVGVGNRHRGDDGVGPRLIDARRPATRGVWLDAGNAPENVLEIIVSTKPDTILIVDAVAFDGFPGERRLMDPTAVDTLALSTHAVPLRLLSDYLSARSGARIRLLGIQPQRIDVREGLSQAVEESVFELAEVLSQVLAAETM